MLRIRSNIEEETTMKAEFLAPTPATIPLAETAAVHRRAEAGQLHGKVVFYS